MAILSVPQTEDSQLITELSVFNSMLVRNPQQFCVSLYEYAQASEDDYLPKHYEEAYCLFVDNMPNMFPYRIEISDATTQRYQSFKAERRRNAQYGDDQKTIGEMPRTDWGDTYWWYNAFGNKKY